MADFKAAAIIASALTDLLNTNIDKMDVYDEMFLIEQGMCGKDVTLNAYIRKMMADHMTPKNATDFSKIKLTYVGKRNTTLGEDNTPDSVNEGD